MSHRARALAGLLALFSSPALMAAESTAGAAPALDLVLHPVGLICLALFAIAYALVIAEERLHLRKSIPVLTAAGVIWTLLGWVYHVHGLPEVVGTVMRHSFLEFAELFFFLLVAMTYINTLEERGVFDALQSWLLARGFSLRSVFWITGALAFVISPVADNMTTALVMASVALAVGRGHPRFIVVACINIVVAANAGGAFSPFGDITTLMVWQKGMLNAGEFLALLLPAAVNWLVPAALMSIAVPAGRPQPLERPATLRHGSLFVVLLFIATISITVTLHVWMELPPVLGMMGGLGLLKLYGYYLHRSEQQELQRIEHTAGLLPARQGLEPYDSYTQLARAEWDTLLFFYGIILCVGGLGLAGYLGLLSAAIYTGLGATAANVLVGVVSAVVDNIPVMYAVLSMNPPMDDGQWLLVTMTAGVGGSLLSIGSAAGVAVMGQARGVYTFFAHLRWSWAVLLGYLASVAVHFWVNAGLFAGPG